MGTLKGGNALFFAASFILQNAFKQIPNVKQDLHDELLPPILKELLFPLCHGIVELLLNLISFSHLLLSKK